MGNKTEHETHKFGLTQLYKKHHIAKQLTNPGRVSSLHRLYTTYISNSKSLNQKQ